MVDRRAIECKLTVKDFVESEWYTSLEDGTESSENDSGDDDDAVGTDGGAPTEPVDSHVVRRTNERRGKSRRRRQRPCVVCWEGRGAKGHQPFVQKDYDRRRNAASTSWVCTHSLCTKAGTTPVHVHPGCLTAHQCAMDEK